MLDQSQALFAQLAVEGRTVLADWRALLLIRRATAATPATQRRWRAAPQTTTDVRRLLRQLVRRGDLRAITGLANIYQVTAPFAPAGAPPENAVLLELNPYASISHLSALVFHELTDQFPLSLTASIPDRGTGDQLPLDSTADDWAGQRRAPGRTPPTIMQRPVHWVRFPTKHCFGSQTYRPQGFSVRVTTLERTLLDALQRPELAGGSQNVLHAWALARDMLDSELLIDYVERFDSGILRQRAGYVLEALGLRHIELDRWAAASVRGGSSKLVAAAPYAPAFSERWNLSLNVPVDALTQVAS